MASVALGYSRSITDPVTWMNDDPISRSEPGQDLGHPVVAVADLNRDGLGAAVLVGKNGPPVAFPE